MAIALLSAGLYGQNIRNGVIVKGRVVEKATENPLSGVSLWCHDTGEAAKLLRVQYTKNDGTFEMTLPAGKRYKFIIRSYGFKADSLMVEVEAVGLDLGTIAIEPGLDISEQQLLKEATVVAERPLLEQHSDRMVYDVTRDPDARRVRMTGILEKIPNINFSTGKLEHSGLPVGRIYIDGEDNEFINAATQFPMNHIRGDVMAQIEVIPPGSPQYNNSVTIINIITSRPLPNGFAAEITAA